MIYEKLEDGLKDMTMLIGIENKKNSVPKERANSGIYQVNEADLARGREAAERLFTCTGEQFFTLLKAAAAAGMVLKT